MASTIKYRYAESNDIDVVVGIYNQNVPQGLATADYVPVSVEDKKNWFNAHNKDKHPLWMIEINHQPIGWISFNQFYTRQAYEGVVEISIYLSLKYQGQGIGKQCLNFAIEQAKTMRIHTVLALIFSHNPSSIALFTKAGFNQWGHFPKIANMPQGWRDLMIYGFRISDSQSN